MSVTEDLTLRMRAQGARNASRDVDRTAQSIDRVGKTARRTSRDTTLLGKSTGLLFKPFRHLREETLGLAKGLAATGLAFGSVEGIKRSIDTTDTLVKTTMGLRTQFGLTTETASGLATVLQARSLQPQALTMGLTALSKQLIAAEHGSRSAQGAFRMFGIDMLGVHSAITSKDGLELAFQTIVDQMTDMHGGTRKAAVGSQLLGRASRGLAPLLQKGALGFKQQMLYAKQYGSTLDETTIKQTEKMAAAQTRAQYAMLGLQTQLGMLASPLVIRANLTLADLVKSFRDGRPEGDKFARSLYTVGKDLEPVGRDLELVGGYLKDHPRLLADAAGAWLLYKTKVLKAISFAPAAYLKGYIAGRGYSRGFAAGSMTGEGRGLLLGAGRGIGLLVGSAAGIYVASEIARALHLENPDPLLFLHPPNAGGPGDTIQRRRRGHTGLGLNADQTVDYYRRHRGELSAAVVSALSSQQQRELGVRLAPNAAGGYAVIHVHTHLDGKEVAKSTHRAAVKRKATR